MTGLYDDYGYDPAVWAEIMREARLERARAERDDDAWHADEDRYDEQRPAPRGVLDD